ncbi:MAG: thymidylate kinase [Clostridiales bacterium]|jgi:dTMP kinase|nr:thymidylate kinase [Clostridiales bacterium]
MKLIVIEGLDGAGKQTQTNMLASWLQSKGKSVKMLDFPNYSSPTGNIIKMYLNGDFGEDAMAVNPYFISTLYALDRATTLIKHDCDAGTHADKRLADYDYLIVDRYVTSNFIYQATKLPEGERTKFINWASDFEYKKLELPQPDCVLFLDVDPEITRALRENRGNKHGGGDIHESDNNYLQNCYDVAKKCCDDLGWKAVECCENNKILPPDTIFDKILDALAEN